MSDLSELQKLLDRAAQEMPNKVLRIIGVEGKNFIQKNFKDQAFTDTGVEKWKRRKVTDRSARSIIRYRTDRVGNKGDLNKYGQSIKGRALLVGNNNDTDGVHLKNTFRYRVSLGSGQVSFYTAKTYAQRHNEGLSGMPRRQFMGKSAYLENQISKKINKELDKILR